MKSALVLGILFQILSGYTLSAFQQSAHPAVTPSLFQQRQSSLFRQSIKESTRKPLLAAVVVDSAVQEAADVAIHNPWERVCTTVQTTTNQLNGLRQKIAKSGVATAISYSLVSNLFTSVAVSLAWYYFSIQTGLSPISPGQWKPFLVKYGAFYTVNSLLKPIRFMVALSVVPYTEQVMATFQANFAGSKKAAVVCCTTLLLLISGCMIASGIGMASLLSGTPIFPASAL